MIAKISIKKDLAKTLTALRALLALGLVLFFGELVFRRWTDFGFSLDRLAWSVAWKGFLLMWTSFTGCCFSWSGGFTVDPP